MSKSVLLVGTRKGLFVLESDDRRDWSVRGPFCESWPVYHAVLDRDSGTIYAAAASEWHGSAIWRSPDLGETWEHSSEGLGYPDEDGGLQALEGLARDAGARAAARRRRGCRALREHRRRQDLLARDDARGPAGPRGVERPGEAAARAPRPLGDHPAPGRGRPLLGDRPGLRPLRDDRRRADVDAAQQGAAPDWPAEYEEIGFCVHKVAPAADFERMYQQNHVGMHRSDDGGKSWTEITEGLPTEFGFAAADAPARPRHLLRDPARPGPRPDDAGRARRPSGARATRGSSWQRLDQRPAAARTRYVGVLREGMTIDGYDAPGLYFGTSTGQLFASADEGESWSEIAASSRDLVGRGRRRSTDGRAAPARRCCRRSSRGCRGELEVEAATVDEAIDRLDERWPGLRDRLVEPGPELRPAHQRLRRPRARRARHDARSAARAST